MLGFKAFRLFRAVKNFIKLFVATVFALGVCVCVKGAHVSPISSLKGAHTYYLNATNSSALIKTDLSAMDLFRVRGESVCFTLNEEAEPFVFALVEEYNGKILFTEEVCGTRSYYAYVPTWKSGVAVNGVNVNLHIAVSENRCVVGTPVIFGGF